MVSSEKVCSLKFWQSRTVHSDALPTPVRENMDKELEALAAKSPGTLLLRLSTTTSCVSSRSILGGCRPSQTAGFELRQRVGDQVCLAQQNYVTMYPASSGVGGRLTQRSLSVAPLNPDFVPCTRNTWSSKDTLFANTPTNGHDGHRYPPSHTLRPAIARMILPYHVAVHC